MPEVEEIIAGLLTQLDSGALAEPRLRSQALGLLRALQGQRPELAPRLEPLLRALGQDDREACRGLLRGLLEACRPRPAFPAMDPAILEEFIAQARQQLDDWERAALALQTQPEAASAQLRRIIHTFKGDLGILDQEQAALICHALEHRIRASELDLLLAGRDYLLGLLAHLAGERAQPDPGPLAALVAEAAADHTPLATPLAGGDEPPQAALSAKEPLPDAANPRPLEAAAWTPAQDPELVAEYLAETEELLAQFEYAIEALDRDPADRVALDDAFRRVHTIKGLAASFGFAEISAASNHAEDLLDAARGGGISLDQQAILLLQRLVDLVRHRLPKLPRQLPSGEATLRLDRELHAGIERLMQGQAPAAVTTPAAAPAARDERLSDQLAIQSSVRVRSDRLDRLLDLVGELVSDHGQDQPGGQRSEITRELQQVVTRLRLVPLVPVFDRLKRSALRVARQLGKTIEIEQQGAETELDKSLVDQIGDVLLHLVNNAVDHGLEDAAERQARGKPASGRIRFDARHEGGRVVISVEDDGRGLDPELIRARALELGLLQPQVELDQAQLLELLCTAGFSTRREATTVSGRGVGLDAVARQVERVQGRLAVRSEPDVGSRFEISLPLTLAIIDAMVFEAGDCCCLLPTAAILQTLRPCELQAAPALDGQRYARLRDEILPLCALRTILGCHGRSEDEPVLILVDDGGRRLLLEVDRVLGQQQVVIKDLGPLLRGLSCLSGCAVLGGRRLGFILNHTALLRHSRGRDGSSTEYATMQIDDPEADAAAAGSHLVFSVAGERFAIPALQVQEIIPQQEPIPLPQAPAHIHGVVNLRGQVVPVMDMRRRLGVDDGHAAALRPCIIVATLPMAGETARVGLLVDEALDLLEVAADAVLPVPALAQQQQQASRSIAGLVRSEETLVVLLRLSALVDGQQLSLSDTHSLAASLDAAASTDGAA